MKNIAVLALFSVSAWGAVIEQPELGSSLCYEASYSADHLRKHPGQTVSAMRLELIRGIITDNSAIDQTFAHLYVAQKDGGMFAAAFDSCFESNGRTLCTIDCDGGSIELVSTQYGYLLHNNGFTYRGGCGSSGERAFFEKTPEHAVFRLRKMDCWGWGEEDH